MDIEQIKDDLHNLNLDIVKVGCSNERLDERYEELKIEVEGLESRVIRIENSLSIYNEPRLIICFVHS